MFRAMKLMTPVLIRAGSAILIAGMLAAGLLLTGCESRPPLALVTDEEAAQPLMRGSFEPQTNGPDIRILAPLGGSTVTVSDTRFERRKKSPAGGEPGFFGFGDRFRSNNCVLQLLTQGLQESSPRPGLFRLFFLPTAETQ